MHVWDHRNENARRTSAVGWKTSIEPCIKHICQAQCNIMFSLPLGSWGSLSIPRSLSSWSRCEGHSPWFEEDTADGWLLMSWCSSQDAPCEVTHGYLALIKADSIEMKHLRACLVLCLLTNSKTIPHFALWCDIDTYWLKSVIRADNFHDVGSWRDVIHSKTAISSIRRECKHNKNSQVIYIYINKQYAIYLYTQWNVLCVHPIHINGGGLNVRNSRQWKTI